MPDDKTCMPLNEDPVDTVVSKDDFVLSIADALVADIVPSTLTDPLVILVIWTKFYFWLSLTFGSLINLTS